MTGPIIACAFLSFSVLKHKILTISSRQFSKYLKNKCILSVDTLDCFLKTLELQLHPIKESFNTTI